MEAENGDDSDAAVHETQVQTNDDPSVDTSDERSHGHTGISEFFRTSGTPARVDHEHEEETKAGVGRGDEADPATGSIDFSLLVILQPDNVRHRVIATPEMTIAELTEAICSDLKLNADLIAFPGLHPTPGLSLSDTPLSAFGFNGNNTNNNGEEPAVQAYVAKKLSTSEHVMPDRIPVQIYDGTSEL